MHIDLKRFFIQHEDIFLALVWKNFIDSATRGPSNSLELSSFTDDELQAYQNTKQRLKYVKMVLFKYKPFCLVLEPFWLDASGLTEAMKCRVS